MKKARQLLEQFRPTEYILDIITDVAKDTFAGTVTIRGQKLGRPSQRLTFHQKNLKITDATITRHDRKGDQNIQLSRINHHRGFDEVRLHSPDKLFAGSYSVTLVFKSDGLEKLQYIDGLEFILANVPGELTVEAFVPERVRNLLPSVDEPAATAKITAKISVQAKT